jgi:hypothetical protein
MLRRPGQRAVSVEDMNEGIAQAAFEADHRSKSKRDKKTVRKPK